MVVTEIERPMSDLTLSQRYGALKRRLPISPLLFASSLIYGKSEREVEAGCIVPYLRRVALGQLTVLA